MLPPKVFTERITNVTQYTDHFFHRFCYPLCLSWDWDDYFYFGRSDYGIVDDYANLRFNLGNSQNQKILEVLNNKQEN
jgi:hypothetical protein